jgi:L-cystine uptake protein TcyP (sodium:dicarboxylate symporter family)
MLNFLKHGCSFRKRLIDVVFGLVVGFLLATDIVFARSIDMTKAGVSLWIFICVGAFIILLQLIPAFILFTSFIATGHKLVKVKESELVNVGKCCEKVE